MTIESRTNLRFILVYILRCRGIVDKFVDNLCIYCVNSHFLYTRNAFITCFFTCVRDALEESFQRYMEVLVRSAQVRIVLGQCAWIAQLPLGDSSESWLRLAGRSGLVLVATIPREGVRRRPNPQGLGM